MAQPEETEVKAGTPSGNSLVYAFKERLPRTAMAFAIGQAAMPLARKAQTWAKERATYVITVSGDDEVYNDLHEWLLEQLPSKDRRSLFAYSSRRSGIELDTVGVWRGGDPGSPAPVIDHEVPDPPPVMHLRYDGSRAQTIALGGHKVKVSSTEAEGIRESGTYFVLKPSKIIFTVSTPAARDAVRAKMDELLALRHATKRQPRLRIAKPWGDWHSQDELPRRSLESVVLPADQQERLVADLGRFLDAEPEYNRRYLPYHRGYLFEGPPGTGKTSIAKALANHFDMDIWYLPLGDIKMGSTLMQLVGAVSSRSMLLIEDIDVFHVAKARDDDRDVTLSDLLNALDGISTPHGLVTVLTSNHAAVLDEALLRAGRVDVKEHFGLAGSEQVDALLQWFYDDPALRSGLRGAAQISPADVVSVMQPNMESPEAAILELKEMVS